MGFKFRKEKKETGLSAVARPYPATRIKIGKDVVGSIDPPSYLRNKSEWVVRFQIVDDQPPKWKWVQLKLKFETEESAREHLEKPETFESLSKILNFHREADDYSDRG